MIGSGALRHYPSATLVPAAIYLDPRLIVEQFVPERRGQWYCHRRYYFLAEAEVNQVWIGTKAICANDEDGDVVEDAPIPAQLRDFRYVASRPYTASVSSPTRRSQSVEGAFLLASSSLITM